MTSAFYLAFVLVSSVSGSKIDCAGIMLGIRHEHSIPAVSEENTRRAKEAVKMIRLQELEISKAWPSIRPVVATSKQGRRFKLMGGRIKGIEFQFENIDEEDEDFVIAGSVLDTPKKLQDFFQKINETRVEYKSIQKEDRRGRRFFISRAILVGAGLVLTAAIPILSYGVLNFKLPTSVKTLSDIGIFVGTPVLIWQARGIFGGAVKLGRRFISESFGRYSNIQKFPNFWRSGDWIWVSRDLSMSKTLKDEAWVNGGISTEGVATQLLTDLITKNERIIYSNSRKPLTPEQRAAVLEEVPIAVDLWYRPGPAGKEKFIVFLRFYHRKNFPPAPDEEKMSIFDVVRGFRAGLIPQ